MENYKIRTLRKVIKNYNKQNRSQFDIVLENVKRINDYDYNKMLDNFELESRHQRIINGIKSKWKNIGLKYKEKLSEYKKQNEKMYKIKNKELQKKIREKDELLHRNIEMNKRLKSEERERKGNLMKQKTENASQNLEEFLSKQEEERLKLERNMFHKSNL